MINNNSLPHLVAKELADIRENLEETKKILNDILDELNIVLNKRSDDIENAVCEQSYISENRIADIEIALCELSEQLNL